MKNNTEATSYRKNINSSEYINIIYKIVFYSTNISEKLKPNTFNIFESKTQL